MASAPSPEELTHHQTGIIAYILLLFMGVAWGLAISMSKIAATAGGHPVSLALWQVCISSVLMGCVLLMSSKPSWPRQSVMGFSLFCGVFGVATPAMILFWCSIYLPAGIVAIAFASMPMFTYALSVLFRVETGATRRFVGVAIGLIAMGLLIFPETALPSPDLAGWVLIALVASVSMSAENVYAGGMRPPSINSVQLSFGRQFAAVLFLSPIAFVVAEPIPVFTDWQHLQWSATAAGLLSGTAFTCLLYVIRTSGPVFASQSAYIITLAGVAWGMILFEETHSTYIWAALVLTILGAAMVRPQLPRLSKLLRVTSGIA